VLELDRQKYTGNLDQYEGMSLRAIAKKTGHHIQTVKKYVEKEDWNGGYKGRKEYPSRLDPLKEVIDGWIREDIGRSRKYRRTATKIYNDLSKEKEYAKQLTVCKQSVINYVSKRKKRNKQRNVWNSNVCIARNVRSTSGFRRYTGKKNQRNGGSAA